MPRTNKNRKILHLYYILRAHQCFYKAHFSALKHTAHRAFSDGKL